MAKRKKTGQTADALGEVLYTRIDAGAIAWLDRRVQAERERRAGSRVARADVVRMIIAKAMESEEP